MASLPKAAFLPVALVTAAVSIAALTAAISSGDDGSAATTTTVAPAEQAVAATIADFAFSPEPVKVKAGQTVTWTNQDPFAHSIKSSDGSFDSASLGQGVSYSARSRRPAPTPTCAGSTTR